jgi:hypothetical protein
MTTANTTSRMGCRSSNALAVSQNMAVDAVTNPTVSAIARLTTSASLIHHTVPEILMRGTRRGRNAACTTPHHERNDRADSKPRQHEGWIRADRRQRAAAALSSVELLQRRAHSRLFAIDELERTLTGQIPVDPSIPRQRFSPFRCDHHGRNDRLRR